MLDKVIAQIDALPPAQRQVLGKVRSGQEVLDALPRVEEFSRAIEERLKEAMLWRLASDGRLVMGDGCAEPAPETLNTGYLRAKSHATAAVYFDPDGDRKVLRLPYLASPFVVKPESITVGVGSSTETIGRDKNQLLWVSRLATSPEYVAVNRGQMDRNTGPRGRHGNKVWLLGAADPHTAPLAWYSAPHEKVEVVEVGAHRLQPNRGARRVVDFYLNLEK